MSTRDRYDKDILKALQTIASSTTRIANCLEKMTCSTNDYSASIDGVLRHYKIMEDKKK